MTSILLQHWTGEMDELGKASTVNISAYATRIGADYRLLRGNVFNEHLTPACQKMYMLDEEFDEYEIVVMLDMDVFAVNDLKENVLTAVEGIGMHTNYTAEIFEKCCQRHPQLTNREFAFWGGAIYRLPRALRKQLRGHLRMKEMLEFSGTYNDEGIMHRAATHARLRLEAAPIPERWCFSSYLARPERAAMIHIRRKATFTGPRGKKIENYESLRRSGIIA